MHLCVFVFVYTCVQWPPRLLDLQLPRRRQTSCPALLALVALCCLRGNRTEGTEFMTEFMDPVRVSWSVQGAVHVVCAQSRRTHRTKRVWSSTNTWRHVALPAAGRLRVSSSSVSARRLFLGPRHPKPALATPHATPSHAAPRHAAPRATPRATSTGRALEHRA